MIAFAAYAQNISIASPSTYPQWELPLNFMDTLIYVLLLQKKKRRHIMFKQNKITTMDSSSRTYQPGSWL